MDKATALRAAIDRLPRVALGLHPTPLEHLPRLTAALDGPPLYIKRDDLTGLAFGGNKTRMLEFSIADALRQQADVIVTGMAVQSNYCRQMAAACAKYGLALHLVLRPVRPIDREQIQGNNLVQRLFGAQVDILSENDRDRQADAIEAKAAALRAAGRRVYVPRQVDTVDLDAIGYAEAALEVVEQCQAFGIRPRYLYVAAADTTQAGLMLGLHYLGSPLHVKGIHPSGRAGAVEKMVEIAARAAHRLGIDAALRAEDVDNDSSFVGDGYGLPTAAGLEAIHLTARHEGILLDPVYTGKAMSALMAHIRQGRLDAHEPVLFLHTGGAPALFGYAEDVLASMPGNANMP